ILAKNEDGLWVHTRFGYSVPRRNGKGEILIMRELYGLAVGEKILHTAHLTSTSHSAWERICSTLDLLKVDYDSIKAKGQEYVKLKHGGEIHFRTRTATGALGEGFDLVVIDEAQEYRTEHQTALKYVVTSSKNPQTILCGTPPTAVSSGTVFKDFRDQVLSGSVANAGWAEWSVERLEDPEDRDLWYECNPSLGITMTERSVADEVGKSEAERIDFNIQRLGLWLRYSQQSIISKAAWDACRVEKVPELKGRLSIGIKYNRDGMTVTLAVAVKTADNRVFTEVAARRLVRDGNGWILAFLHGVGRANIGRIYADGANGIEILKKDMKDDHLGVLTPVSVKEVIEANQSFENAIYKKELCHMEQPSLSAVVTNCERRAIGTGGGFGWKPIQEQADISLMEAAALAHYGAKTMKEAKQSVSF
ncbi:MAG: terminase, partial [Oscillospiraceae bacterium]|nr:terminase [Oscillospiraceae bacterium]